MKSILLLTVILFGSALTSHAQKKTATTLSIPESVEAVFRKSFPAATSVHWEKEKSDYEANFSSSGMKMSALISAKGDLLETETVIRAEELPSAARDWVHQQYKGDSIREAARITKSNGETNYEAEVNHHDLIFDANGKFLRKE